eukprot:tig00021254_g19702.t1
MAFSTVVPVQAASRADVALRASTAALAPAHRQEASAVSAKASRFLGSQLQSTRFAASSGRRFVFSCQASAATSIFDAKPKADMPEEEVARREELENRLGPHIRGKMMEAVEIKTPVLSKDPMEFFAKSAGNWSSFRCTHHLAFRRIETGGSDIKVEVMGPEDERIVELCKAHGVDPSMTVGGAYVSWHANMSWDSEGESHDGETLFAVVPRPDNPRVGKLLRDRGYAEKIPVMGDFMLEEDGSMILITEYDVMSVHERLFFDGEDRRYRTSTVKVHGGFTTATVAMEARPQADGGNPFEDAELKGAVEKIKNIKFTPFPPAPKAA